MAMQLDPEIRSRLVHLLYSAMPQVVSSTLGTVLLAIFVWWRVPSAWMLAVIAAAVGVTVIRLGILIAYRRSNNDNPAAPTAAVRWERLYGAFSIAMALVIGAILLTAFLRGDSGVRLLSSGVAIGICGGQSTTRVTCRPWIPFASGSVILGALAICALYWKDPYAPVLAGYVVLYFYTYIEACRHSARTILGRLVAENELAELARHDTLTGLANRMGFGEELERAFHALRRNGGGIALLMLDLDGFKAVNDELGHPAGDAVLREVADRLRRLSRQTDYLARIGGDEFAIVVTDRHDRESLAVYAQRLIGGLSQPFVLAGREVHIGVSIGVGMATRRGPRELTELLAIADAALYQVKKGTKNDVAFADIAYPAE